MAKDSSFDVVSEIDMQEVSNAITQANKEILQRYDFKNSKSEITLDEESLKIVSEDQYKLDSVIDILKTKLVKRNVSIKNFDYGKVEDASKGTVRQTIKIKQGIETEKAKEIVKAIKETKIKVQVQIMGDQVRVTGKNKDDLQAVLHFLKANDYGIELQITNYR